MASDVVLIAPASLRERDEYVSFARALGRPVRVSEEIEDGDAILVPSAWLHETLRVLGDGAAPRIVILDAAINDPARAALDGMLGAVPRRNEFGALFGRADVVAKMPGRVELGSRLGDYVYVSGDDAPALLAAYLEAAGA